LGCSDKLTAESLAFVDLEVSRQRDTSNGWRSPFAILIDQLGAEVSPENVAILEQMMGVDPPPQERLEFLG